MQKKVENKAENSVGTNKWAFFGTSAFSVHVLNALLNEGLRPALIVTTPDAPSGRGLALTPPPTKVWAIEHSIPVFQPEKLDAATKAQLIELAGETHWKLFLVASYGKIIPADIFNIPTRKTLNIHPSLLPKWRGSSPIQSAMLAHEAETGVTIMQIDEKMDHGPLLVKEEFGIPVPLPDYDTIEAELAAIGAHLFAGILPKWMEGSLKVIPQDEEKVILSKKITKEDGKIDEDLTKLATISPERQYELFVTIQALKGWPNTYFFTERKGKKIRVVITEAEWDKTLTIKKVIPEGKKEMAYEDFLKGF